MTQLLLDDADSVFGRGLQVARLFVFGVLGKVAERASIFELFGDFAPAHGLQMLELCRKLVKFFFAQIVGVVIHIGWRPPMKACCIIPDTVLSTISRSVLLVPGASIRIIYP